MLFYEDNYGQILHNLGYDKEWLWELNKKLYLHVNGDYTHQVSSPYKTFKLTPMTLKIKYHVMMYLSFGLVSLDVQKLSMPVDCGRIIQISIPMDSQYSGV